MCALFAPFEPGFENPDGPFRGQVRAATPSDADALAALQVAREGGELEECAQSVRDEFQRIEGGAARHLWLATEAGAALGFARTWYWDRPAQARPRAGPSGWYLAGVIVAEAHRRRGVARALTRVRLDWIAQRADEAFYVVNEHNRPSLDLHRAFAFEERYRGVWLPGCQFTGGEGILLRAPLETTR